MTLHEMRRRLDGFDLIQTVSDSVDETKEEMVELNRMQLLRGLDSDGNYLSPKYSEDPYFKSKEAAARYAAWKKSNEPIKTDRPVDVPNLFINGYFHSLIKLSVSAEEYTFSNGASFGGNVESKFGDVIYGLNNETKSNTYIPDYLLPAVKRRVTNSLGFKFG